MKFKEIELEGTYELKVYEKHFKVYDSKGNRVYYEQSNGSWEKREYDSKGNEVYFEDSDGYWYKSEYDSKRNCVYYEESNGFWEKSEYDSKGNEVYYEDSDGVVEDKRVKELSIKEISKLLGYEVKVVK